MAPRWPMSDGGAWEGVRLLEADPDLALGVPVAAQAWTRELRVPALRPPPGPWKPPASLHAVLGVLVLDGLMTATSRAFAHEDIQLLGPGDTLDNRALADQEVAWRVLAPAHLAVLDERFVLAARWCPPLFTGLVRRLSETEREQHIRASICTMPHVEERVLALLCHLALRWGHVTPDGVTLHLPVTHETLGRLIGARRPTVSLALLALTDHGLVTRRDNGTWLLPRECREWPTTGIPRNRRPLAA
jgi:CRP/FNR family transcriptional regulator, cyclic AMP receptor protein